MKISQTKNGRHRILGCLLGFGVRVCLSVCRFFYLSISLSLCRSVFLLLLELEFVFATVIGLQGFSDFQQPILLLFIQIFENFKWWSCSLISIISCWCVIVCLWILIRPWIQCWKWDSSAPDFELVRFLWFSATDFVVIYSDFWEY